MLVVDEAEYMELFNQGKEAKEEREAYILDRLNIGQEESQQEDSG